ncbi:coagulation factor XIII A chain [Perca flavescens]|uniref:coagulation factor XIII A chain n=1 Tax=Perca flavescens TaxID=8167 RepID=UPI00106EE3C5|nr:coagulation factor XIII A chain [Perca flavescens]XP_028462047.1 coagulation factor XIII A chain [Perca flavescens]XP_028462048.1 coagulation factor XIII A chain [Perca flavescens]XP_028462049.1 coagulation factor XIII A chain [Perca flavescens]XP_028462050.1 coagulation factor XIII A chain [Perca flavescens]XP_028462051.1 coagulation factor XIII A chain [Perca flavescens]XP_028462052.1 coagulation factor XIII A chain [Perca flavescens]XP_028462053.1 coagulation factor XIII A chain [Perca
MSDQGATPTPSVPPPAPTGPPPKVTNRGRTAVPISSSNSDSTDIPEFEPFVLPGPRGFPPMTEYLDILDVDMMRRPEEPNKKQHHTEFFNSDYLIVRRGQEFQVKITFNRPYNPATDKFAVEFVIGSSPQFSKGTYIPVFTAKERPSPWEGRATDTADNTVTMGITPAADCIVGKYHMFVAVVTPFGIRRTRRDNSRDLYILFNPWVSADAVFLDDEKERQECVMTEMGIIYHGAYDDVAERDWNYGQFNYGVLDACLYIMDRSDMPIINRGDPVRVTRKASAMLNSRDDEGVLVGNWSGDYTYGVAPTSWTGSTDILLSYANSKMPVCYAQCWVYAAVFNTFLRCLGIPSRVVTNFYSAHDNDGNLRTDIILDENGRVDRGRTKDSIWNYHCWNECYMSRPDLPTGFGGWQVVDATPQETSDGMYRCGPASVKAIKHGQICFPFDAAFVFAEVNSDVVFYSRSKDGTMEPVKVNRTHIGRMVVTKTPGDVTRRDISDNYKFPEGSTEERTVLEKAEEYGCQREKSNPPVADVDLVLPTLEISVGDDFELSLEFINRSTQRRTVDAYISGSVVYYTGVTSYEFLFRNPTVKIGPNQSVKESMMVESKNYMKQLVEQANLHFIATGKIKETGQIVTAMKVVTLHNPKLTVTVSDGGKVNEEMTATVEFTNPFTSSLEGVYIRMEGPGIMLPKSKYYSLIPGSSSLTWTEFFTPQRAGRSRVIASLDCSAVRQVYGQASVTIAP